MSTANSQRDRSYPSGAFAFSGEEVLGENAFTRVVRVYPPGGGPSVIRKEPQGTDAAQRLRHETAILERLAAVDGVSHLAPGSKDSGALLLEDEAGTTLTESVSANPFSGADLVEFALSMAQIVAQVHHNGVVHKDINPSNILVSGTRRTPTLIDFHLASTFAEDRPGFTPTREIPGTLPYLAPEQTGRTGRRVDQRSDLYALGATLYELATGQPPFGDGEPFQVIYDHLARVPRPPVEVAHISLAMSDIIMRLLEKEPDRRYQSAEGLAHDLAELRDRDADDNRPLALGEHDFPLRLSAPSRLVGRKAEIEALSSAFTDASRGRGRGVLIAGAPGVGKTALIAELRPLVTAHGGWSVAGKFDQYSRDMRSDGVWQAFRALGRLLLAEPEEGLVEQRARLLDSLGNNAGLIAAILPEFALLLDVPAESSVADPTVADSRLQQASLDLLRGIVSMGRPLVVVLDDLQWAGRTPVGLVDAILTDESLKGLLLVVSYRDSEIGPIHPLSATVSRWERLDTAPLTVRLENLPPADLVTLLEEMLRLSRHEAAHLANVIGERTDGNPYDTVELVNALRRDGALAQQDGGWHWDAGAVRRYIGQGDVVDLLRTRIEALPPPSRELLEIMACLGGKVELDLLGAATDTSATELEARLEAPLESGLLAMDRTGGDAAIRFRHDRVQQAAYRRLIPLQRSNLHLSLARRLARRTEFTAIAAEQYLAVTAAVHNPDEIRRMADLFHQAAIDVRAINPVIAERFLAIAVRKLQTVETPADAAALFAMENQRHGVYYDLGRHDDVDSVYRLIEGRSRDPHALVDATYVQVASLCDRGREAEGVELGLKLLRRLGLDAPLAQIAAPTQSQWEGLRRWVESLDVSAELRRPSYDDPHDQAIARVISGLIAPAYFAHPKVVAWLVLESQRLWVEHGPSASLTVAIGMTAVITVALRQDYRSGYLAVRHTLAVSEARGYEPATSQIRTCFALFCSHWFEPLENTIGQAQLARERLLRGGYLQGACYTYAATMGAMLECGPTIDALEEEVEPAIALAAATNNGHSLAGFISYRQLVRALRGQTDELGGFSDSSFDERAHLAGPAAHPVDASMYRINRSLAAAVFDDGDTLIEHAAATMPLISQQGGYREAIAHVFEGLAQARLAKVGSPQERAAALEALDACRDWLALRADDAPDNFLHLVRLVEAERAWATGDHSAAVHAFDAAISATEARQRPWHRALITERAALYHLEEGLEHIGRTLLAEARQCYQAWGATAKVEQLERNFAFLHTAASGPMPVARGTGRVTSDEIDLVALLQASQALSKETTLDRLRKQIVETLTGMTGATAVQVLIRDGDTQTWLMTSEQGAPISVDEAADQGLVPISAFRYAERTREPLLVDDASRDYRFSGDPYLGALDRCSLLIVPILSHGSNIAMLVLENQLSRGAFTADRLDAVMLIVGQLAVSLDNASLYASLSRKVAERTSDLEVANDRLEVLAVTDPLTGLANRRRLIDVLEVELLRSQRTGSTTGVMMIDIDHFKLFNDRYGHVAGDECLRRVAAALEQSVRGSDMIARYGGEEFAVVLPHTDLAGVHVIAERARTTVVELQEHHGGSPNGFVTVSIGIASDAATPQTTAEQVLDAADVELYEAKRQGRNQTQGNR